MSYKANKGKVLSIALASLAFFMLAAGSGSSGSGSNVQKIGEVESSGEVQNDNISSTNNDSTETASISSYYVGDIIQTDKLKIVYKSSGEYTSENEFIKPEEGNKFIYIELYCENISDSDSGITDWDFECYADGYACNPKFCDDGLSATLSPGRSTSGKMVFEVPENASDIEIEYEVNMLTEEKALFIYEGDKDSGFAEEKSSVVSQNAFKPGDIITTDKVVIKYLSCGVYESENEFIIPKDGYHYIYCEFEFENVSDSDTAVSQFDFDCFADGASCESFFGIDNELSATLSPNRKTKGKIGFEVPDDAQNIEIEYVNNMWTSDRIVFSYE